MKTLRDIKKDATKLLDFLSFFQSVCSKYDMEFIMNKNSGEESFIKRKRFYELRKKAMDELNEYIKENSLGSLLDKIKITGDEKFNLYKLFCLKMNLDGEFDFTNVQEELVEGDIDLEYKVERVLEDVYFGDEKRSKLFKFKVFLENWIDQNPFFPDLDNDFSERIQFVKEEAGKIVEQLNSINQDDVGRGTSLYYFKHDLIEMINTCNKAKPIIDKASLADINFESVGTIDMSFLNRINSSLSEMSELELILVDGIEEFIEKVKKAMGGNEYSDSEVEEIRELGLNLNKQLNKLQRTDIVKNIYEEAGYDFEDEVLSKFKYSLNTILTKQGRKQKELEYKINQLQEVSISFFKMWDFYLLLDAVENNPEEYLTQIGGVEDLVEEIKKSNSFFNKLKGFVMDVSPNDILAKVDSRLDSLTNSFLQQNKELLKCVQESTVMISEIAPVVGPIVKLALITLSYKNKFKNNKIKEQLKSDMRIQHNNIKDKIERSLNLKIDNYRKSLK